MDVLEAIDDRRSTRVFLKKTINKEILEKLLTLATQAPSAINLQPWEFIVVSGEEKERLGRLLVKRLKERNVSCGPGSKSPLPKYFVERQRGLLNIMRPGLPENMKVSDFVNEGSCNFYGAPTGILIAIDDVFSSIRYADIGIVVGYLVLAAHGLGLGTCPVGLITEFDDDIKETLSIPEQKKIILGIAVGYRDEKAPLNKSRSQRAPLEEFVKWRE